MLWLSPLQINDLLCTLTHIYTQANSRAASQFSTAGFLFREPRCSLLILGGRITFFSSLLYFQRITRAAQVNGGRFQPHYLSTTVENSCIKCVGEVEWGGPLAEQCIGPTRVSKGGEAATEAHLRCSWLRQSYFWTGERPLPPPLPSIPCSSSGGETTRPLHSPPPPVTDTTKEWIHYSHGLLGGLEHEGGKC